LFGFCKDFELFVSWFVFVFFEKFFFVHLGAHLFCVFVNEFCNYAVKALTWGFEILQVIIRILSYLDYF